MDLGQVVNTLNDVGSNIYDKSRKERVARWNNVPTQTYYNLDKPAWERIVADYEYDIEQMTIHCNEIEAYHNVPVGTFLALIPLQWKDKYNSWRNRNATSSNG
jgi:hypothetical protein